MIASFGTLATVLYAPLEAKITVGTSWFEEIAEGVSGTEAALSALGENLGLLARSIVGR